jgi:catechol 2,3-dioxygenase-like lactoylglutathione lyase family enzyme
MLGVLLGVVSYFGLPQLGATLAAVDRCAGEVERLDDFTCLIDALLTYVNRYNLWLYQTFPWRLGTFFPKPGLADARLARSFGAPALSTPDMTDTAFYANIFRANNAFFYYADLRGAVKFYEEIMGFVPVADYGMAVIFRVAPTSYLTLVDATRGMHTADEPKTVTYALVTDEVEGWHTYLAGQGVSIQRPLEAKVGQGHDGFVALDPEGYFLEVERFHPHPENEQLLPRLETLPALYPTAGAKTERPQTLGVRATVLWLYYQEIEQAHHFLTEQLGLPMVADQGFARIYASSPSGFLGAVIGGQGLHPYTEQKAVTVSLLTDDIEGWFARLQQAGIPLRHSEIVTRNPRYKAFVAYDPEGTYFEFNTFLEHEENRELMRFLYEGRQP